MNRRDIESMFDKEIWNFFVNEFWYWRANKDVDSKQIKSFFFDTILPEVLRDIIDVDIDRNDDISSIEEIRWYKCCILDIKERAKEKYNITL